MKATLRRFLFDTRAGDLVCRALERLTGCALVDVDEIEYVRVAATAKGRATKSRAPTRV